MATSTPRLLKRRSVTLPVSLVLKDISISREVGLGNIDRIAKASDVGVSATIFVRGALRNPKMHRVWKVQNKLGKFVGVYINSGCSGFVISYAINPLM